MNRVAAREFVLAAKDDVWRKDCFTVSLSGGSTPRAFYSALAATPELRGQIPWSKCFFFWGDERHVPPDHSDSNFRMAKEALLQSVPVKPFQIFRISGELDDASESAREYERILSAFFKLKTGQFPRFDLTLLGMGPDGHTASLFPGTDAPREIKRMVVPNWVEKLSANRITMTVPVFNNSARVMFLVAGEDKASAVKAVLEGPFMPTEFPAQLIQPHKGSVLWLIDQRAGHLLETMSFQELS